MAYAIETHQITKVFGETVANDAIDLSVIEGHIHDIFDPGKQLNRNGIQDGCSG